MHFEDEILFLRFIIFQYNFQNLFSENSQKRETDLYFSLYFVLALMSQLRIITSEGLGIVCILVLPLANQRCHACQNVISRGFRMICHLAFASHVIWYAVKSGFTLHVKKKKPHG